MEAEEELKTSFFKEGGLGQLRAGKWKGFSVTDLTPRLDSHSPQVTDVYPGAEGPGCRTRNFIPAQTAAPHISLLSLTS